MWIRTQSRTCLVNVNVIDTIAETQIYGAINSDYSEEPTYLLGEYKTEEEAMAVLDKIQKAIANMDDVFAMPEAGGA